MNIFTTMAEDVRAVKSNDPAACSSFLIWLVYPGLHARWAHVFEHWLWKKGAHGLARWFSQWTRNRTGVEIHPAAQIGRRFFIDHAMAVIIGETTVIGDDCVLYQGVTLGGTGKESGKRHPTLGNNVMVGVGAKVLGSVTIGDNCKIGGGAVVLKDIPPNCTVVGVPGHIVLQDGIRVDEETEDEAERKEYLPDPMEEEIDSLRRELAAIELRINQMHPGSMDDLTNAPKGMHPGKVSTPVIGCAALHDVTDDCVQDAAADAGKTPVGNESDKEA